MNFKNFWLAKRNEKNVLKVVEWAHRNSILIEDMSTQQIMEASLLFLRNSSHF